MPELQRRISDAIDRLEPVDGVRTWPGATEEEIDAAEAALGVRLHPDHRALLKRTNGLEIGYGRLRLFGVGPRAVVDLVWFNDPATWLDPAYPDRPDLRDFVYVGSSELPIAHGYRRDQTGPEAGILLQVMPELAGLVRGQLTLLWFLEDGYQKVARNAASKEQYGSEYLDMHGPIPMDKGIVNGPRVFFADRYEGSSAPGSQLLTIEQAYITFADLWHHSDELDLTGQLDDLEIVGTTTIPDERGLPRSQWVTRRRTRGGQVHSQPD